MQQSGIGYISPRYKKDDFINLNLQINSNEYIWEKAIDIFKDRMEGRYFNIIDELKWNPNKNGFVIIAIECLLIETLCQFKKGVASTWNNRVTYTDFLTSEFPDIFDDKKADLFYKHIRCGILHSAQTKKGSQLTYGYDYSVELFDNNKIRVDVICFTEDL